MYEEWDEVGLSGVCEELDSVGLMGYVKVNEMAKSGNDMCWNNDNEDV